jgi:hypothetical protein
LKLASKGFVAAQISLPFFVYAASFFVDCFFDLRQDFRLKAIKYSDVYQIR